MRNGLAAMKEMFDQALADARDIFAIEKLEIEYLGRKGQLTKTLRSLKDKPEAERRLAGRSANELKQYFQSRLASRMNEIKTLEENALLQRERIDVTAPGIRYKRGTLHPLTMVMREVIDIFSSLGFSVAEGPEVETERYNFDALNIPSDHPARALWDTFWLANNHKRLLMRTHTSPVQIRFMETHKPPFKIIAPGVVFRYEATDALHDIQFWQLEGLVVGKEISVANFKHIIEVFFEQFFKTGIEIRLRPSYFPFTEPSFEVDMKNKKNGTWLEVAGAGMVHPYVLRNAGVDPDLWQGFAFGMGIDRLAMLKYKIPDIRLFRENNIAFLRQFSHL